jgi:signal transduction histidine kinase
MESTIFHFFVGQMDELALLSGTAFIVLAAVCSLLQLRQGIPVAWGWLALFGLLRGVIEWLGIIAPFCPLGPLFPALRAVVIAFAYAALLEFGRSGITHPTKAPGVSRWIFLPLGALVLAGGRAGPAGMDAMAGYALGLPGAISAALVLMRSAELDRERSTWLRTAAAGFFLMALVIVVSVPQAPFVPASIVNAERFFVRLGVPASLASLVVCLGTAAALWLYGQRLRAIAVKWEGVLRAPARARWFAAALAILLAGGWIVADRAGAAAEERWRHDLLEDARSAAAAIDLSRIASLSGSSADLTNRDYLRLRAQLIGMAAARSFLGAFSIITVRGGRTTIDVSSVPEGSPDFRAPGTPVADPPPALLMLLTRGEAGVAGPFLDRRGAMLTAYAPLWAPLAREVVGALALDVDASAWRLNRDAERLVPISVSMFIALLLIGAFVSGHRYQTAAEQIVESEDHLAKAQALAHVGSWTYHVATGRIRWSDEMFRIVGRNPALGAPTFPEGFQHLLPAQDWEGLRAAIEGALREGRSTALELRLLRPDGSMRTVTTAIDVQRAASGEVVQLLGTTQDITDRKRMEDELIRSRDELVRLAAVKDDFTAMVTHELRTPLASLRAAIAMVEEGVAGPLAAAQKETLAVASRNLDRLGTLVDNLLDAASLESEKMELRLEEVDLGPLVAELCRTMQPAADQRQIGMQLTLPEHPLRATCDAARIRGVIANLVNNALKFTPSGGAVEVRLSCTEGMVHVSVSDTGIGIPEADLPKLFQKFSKVHTEDLWKAGGSGLGLAISMQIVKKHRGTITVESVAGKGSTFTVIFPNALPSNVERGA